MCPHKPGKGRGEERDGRSVGVEKKGGKLGSKVKAEGVMCNK